MSLRPRFRVNNREFRQGIVAGEVQAKRYAPSGDVYDEVSVTRLRNS